MFRRILKEQRGAFMVFFAILVPLFIGMIGFAVDAGFIYMQKAKMQDIADAAALAGAARLNDGAERDGNVASAIRAYAKANGLKITTATSDKLTIWNVNETNLDLTLGKKEDLKMGEVIQTGVTDKDGKQRDHVKVVIAKRVPTFFINVLFPDQKDDVVVKVAAAAEYVEGEEVPVSYGGAKIFGGQLEQDYNSASSIVLKKGTDFSMFAGSGIQNNKVPEGSVGTFYGPEWQPNLPEGWEKVRMKNDWYDYDDKEEKQAYDEMISLLDKKIAQYSSEREKYINSKSQYVNGDGNKRYIGFDSRKNEIIDNIKEGDDNIELYMDGSFAELENNQTNVVLTNSQLRGVKNVKKLIFGKETQWGIQNYKINVIATTDVYYGDIYASPSSRISLSGERNHFNGLVYTSDELRIGGYDNYFNESGKLELFACRPNGDRIYTGIVKIGYWDKAVESKNTDGKVIIKMDWNQNESNNSSWHMYWGGTGSSSSGSGSSGSDDSGDDVKAHVRLVE